MSAATPLLAYSALQHLLAVFGGIVAAPLIIANGMGLSASMTNSIIAASLFTSGVATWIQVNRVGVLGSGLLSIQGTSFTFIGAIVFAFHSLPESMPPTQRLATIFGSSALAACCMFILASQVPRLGRILSPAVTGSTVALLGATLSLTTCGNLVSSIAAQSTQSAQIEASILSALVFALTGLLALFGPAWARLSCILLGLSLGSAIAFARGWVDTSVVSGLPVLAAPAVFEYGFAVDVAVVLTLLPIFLVTAMESVGDLTATQLLSGLPTQGKNYWRRIRGGLAADAFNSFLASVLTTFPNTTFSQNNGVIRLTGVSDPKVGRWVAGMLIVLGLFPAVAAVFQLVPVFILHVVTLIMFILIAVTGVNLLRNAELGRRGWLVVAAALLGGPLVSQLVAQWEWLPERLAMILQYPVSTGAFLALAFELLLPRGVPAQH